MATPIRKVTAPAVSRPATKAATPSTTHAIKDEGKPTPTKTPTWFRLPKGLFQPNLSRESRVLIDSIDNDRPDVFIAILSKFVSKQHRNESQVLYDAMSHLIKSSKTSPDAKKGLYAMFLVARWVKARHFVNASPKLDKLALNLLKKFKMRKEAWHLRGLLMISDPGEFMEKHNEVIKIAHRIGTSIGKFRAGLIAECASVIMMLLSTQPIKLKPSKFVRTLLYARWLFRSDIQPFIDPRFIAAMADHSKYPLIRCIASLLVARTLPPEKAYSVLRRRLLKEKHLYSRLMAARTMVFLSIKHKQILASQVRDDLAQAVLSGNNVGRKILGDLISSAIIANVFKWPIPAFENVLNSTDRSKVAVELCFRVIEAISWMKIPQARARLRELTKSKDPTLAKSALRAYAARLVAEMKPPKHKAIGPGESYHFPKVKDPWAYTFSQDKVRIEGNLAKSSSKQFDWNKDGFLQGSYERYHLWKQVGKLHSTILHLEKIQKKANDSVLDSALVSYREELKSLLPLYRNLPQVNFRNQTVRVYGQMVRIKSKAGPVSQETLFAIGEALQSAPPYIITKLLKDKPKPLTFVVKKLKDDNTCAIYHKIKKEISINERHLKSGSLATLITYVKHEIGHAVDHWLGRKRIEKAMCVIRSKIPIISLIPIKMKCTTVLKKAVIKRVYRSDFPDFIKYYRDRMRMAGLTYKVIADWRKQQKRCNKSCVINKTQRKRWKNIFRRTNHHFMWMYGAINRHEDFATMWESYWTLPSPWTKKYDLGTRKDVIERSPLHYDYFENMWAPEGNR